MSQSSAANSADAIFRLLDKPVVLADLDAGAALAAQPLEQRSIRSVRVLLFRLGGTSDGENAALFANSLRRVTPLARAVPIPHRSHGVLRGVCNIRGELVLCASLHRLLTLSDPPPGESDGENALDTRRMIVIGPSENSWVFEVDGLLGVENVDPATFRQPPLTVAHSMTDYTIGVTDIGGRSVTVLDSERVLAGFKAGLA